MSKNPENPDKSSRMLFSGAYTIYLIFNSFNHIKKLMIFIKLMTNKIIFIFFLIIVAQAQHDDDHESMTTASAWGFGVLAGAGIFLIGVLSALLVVWLKRCVS